MCELTGLGEANLTLIVRGKPLQGQPLGLADNGIVWRPNTCFVRAPAVPTLLLQIKSKASTAPLSALPAIDLSG